MLRTCYRVLIVDSTTIDRKLLLNYLSEIKEVTYEGDEATSLGEAINKIQGNPGRYDLVILDLRLSDSNGVDTFTDFHKQFPEMPCIIMTTYGNDDMIETALDAGAHDYLIKGQFTANTLRRSISLAVKKEMARKLIKEIF